MSQSSKQDPLMLDLLDFFKSVDGAAYCVVKMSPDFPRHAPGEDIDIFCYPLSDFVARILLWGDRFVKQGGRIKVQDLHGKTQVHVDFFKDARLLFRFDLYGALPAYQKLRIKPALFESVIENAGRHPFGNGASAVEVKVPATVDDLLIRYLEFMEYYDAKPGKIKHLDFIVGSAGEATTARLLEKLHHYTKLPPVYVPTRACLFCGIAGRLKKLLAGG